MIITHRFKKKYTLVLLVTGVFLYACNNADTNKRPASDSGHIKVNRDTFIQKTGNLPQKAPIVNIADTVTVKQWVIYAKDSALYNERINVKLAKIYGRLLPDVVKKNKLKITGPPMAWYKTQKGPFFFEAGLPVDKRPGKLPKNIFARQIGGDSAVVAHFFGPYDITIMGHEALNDWLRAKKKKRKAPAYEIYVGDPFDKDGKPVDPYRVQTDIVFPYQ
jgi:hypothetical protein